MMSMNQRKARGAEYCQAYAALKGAYGYSKAQMFVVLKAYQIYFEDARSDKDASQCGWLLDYYDVSPAAFHDSGYMIYISELKDIEPTFWETSEEPGRIRISDTGCAFVEQNQDLWKAAQEMLPAVTRFRRG